MSLKNIKMNNKFKKIYRIDTVRAKWWDYAADGDYYITICTKDRICYFGNCINGQMILSNEGKLAAEILELMPNQFENVKLGEFIVMPNHLHFVVSLSNNIETFPQNIAQNIGGITKEKNPMLTSSLGTVLRWYKGRASFEIHKINAEFKWQPLYWDSIVIDSEKLDIIIEYIQKNPENWQKDKFYIGNK